MQSLLTINHCIEIGRLLVFRLIEPVLPVLVQDRQSSKNTETSDVPTLETVMSLSTLIVKPSWRLCTCINEPRRTRRWFVVTYSREVHCPLQASAPLAAKIRRCVAYCGETIISVDFVAKASTAPRSWERRPRDTHPPADFNRSTVMLGSVELSWSRFGAVRACIGRPR